MNEPIQRVHLMVRARTVAHVGTSNAAAWWDTQARFVRIQLMSVQVRHANTVAVAKMTLEDIRAYALQVYYCDMLYYHQLFDTVVIARSERWCCS